MYNYFSERTMFLETKWTRAVYEERANPIFWGAFFFYSSFFVSLAFFVLWNIYFKYHCVVSELFTLCKCIYLVIVLYQFGSRMFVILRLILSLSTAFDSFLQLVLPWHLEAAFLLFQNVEHCSYSKCIQILSKLFHVTTFHCWKGGFLHWKPVYYENADTNCGNGIVPFFKIYL